MARDADDAAVARGWQKLAAAAPHAIAVERSRWGRPAGVVVAPAARTAELSVSSFDRELDWRWRRTSYTDITAAAYEARVGSRARAAADRRRARVAGRRHRRRPRRLAPLSTPSLLAEMGMGVDVGTFVHRVMEATDFAAADLEAELGAAGRRGACAAGCRDRRP